MSGEPSKRDVINYQFKANGWTVGIEEGRALERAAQAARKTRKPSLKRQIAAAERAGKTVTSITTVDGTTLRFGEPSTDKPGNELDQWIANHARASEGH